jgi:hypothetical protein
MTFPASAIAAATAPGYYYFHDSMSGLFGFANTHGSHHVQCRPAAIAPDAADVALNIPRLSRREGATLLKLARDAAGSLGYTRLIAIAEPHQRAWYLRHGFAPDPRATRGSPILIAPLGAAPPRTA